VNQLRFTTATRVGVNVLALLGVIVALYLGKSILIPLVIAVLLAAMVWPVAAWLNRTAHLSWGFACMIVVGSLVVLNLLVTFGFFMALPAMLQGMPDLRTEPGQEELYRMIRNRVGLVLPLDEQMFPADPSDSRVFGYIQQTLREGTYVTNLLWSIGSYGNAWLWQWVLVMFTLLFLLLEGQMLSRRLVEIFGPAQDTQAKAVETLAEIARAVRTYLVWRTLVNVLLGVAVALVYKWAFDLTQPWTWGLLTMVACYVPYLGPIFAGIPPLLDAFFLSAHSPWYAVGVLAFYIAIITVEGYVLVPVVMGRSMELNATTVILSCMFWELVWGLPGLFLAMPLMAALKAVCAHVPGWRAWANLMGTGETGPPEPETLEEEIRLTEPGTEDTQILSAAEVEATVARQEGEEGT
jgi:AI-2 transport protein TqsA